MPFFTKFVYSVKKVPVCLTGMYGHKKALVATHLRCGWISDYQQQ